jgi:hypothetical protein
VSHRQFSGSQNEAVNGMSMMHKGKGQQDGCHHGKGQHVERGQAVHHLDIIEARMAKIEAMLEILMRR